MISMELTYLRWHQDVKPNNILILSGKSGHPYDVEFKLADLGLSHFKRTAKLNRGIVDRDIGGTKDYGKMLLSYSCKVSQADTLERCARVPSKRRIPRAEQIERQAVNRHLVFWWRVQ